MEFPVTSFALTRPVQLAGAAATERMVVRVTGDQPTSPVVLEFLETWLITFPDAEPAAAPEEILPPKHIAAIHRHLLDRADAVSSQHLVAFLERIDLVPEGRFEEQLRALAALVKKDSFSRLEIHLAALLEQELDADQGRPERLSVLLRCLCIMSLLRRVATDRSSVDSEAQVASFLLEAIVALPKSRFPAPAAALARPPAIADLLVIRQRVARYELGEIAHIENVLKNEKKQRVHRRLEEHEETIVTEQETERIDERDTQTTERFELQSEVSSLVQQSTAVEAGLEVSASYGPTVSMTASANVAVTWSQQEARRIASNYAKEITERAASRVRQRTLERRTRREQLTIEETNTHGIDNTGDRATNISGIYRWVDKVYRAQVFRYGRRLMLEFIVPEPGVFARTAILAAPLRGVTAREPPVPSYKDSELSVDLVAMDNYLEIAAPYYVRELTPPPAARTVALAWDQSAERAANKFYYKARKEIQIPDDCHAVSFTATVAASAWKHDVQLSVGTTVVSGTDPQVTGGSADKGAFPPITIAQTFLKKERGELPVSVVIQDVWEYAVNIVVVCEPTAEALMKWKLATYSAIMSAYFELKSEYDSQVRAAESSRGVEIQGRNPLENEMLQRNELKRGVISLLTEQHFDQAPLDEDSITQLDLTKGGTKYPAIEFSAAQRERDYIQWFEQAFEWTNMTFVYYPYYWARRDQWLNNFSTVETDPLFKQFLTAGAARVQVPVRPGFDRAMTFYLATGRIWLGTAVPQIGDSLYVSILNELKEQQDPLLGGTAVGEPWEVRLPTSFVMLQSGSELPDSQQ